jgi:hypothetical protein
MAIPFSKIANILIVFPAIKFIIIDKVIKTEADSLCFSSQ